MFNYGTVRLLCLDPDENEKITAEGMMKFLEDLQLHPESRIVLVLAWRFKAATQCEFTREEFDCSFRCLR